MADPVSEDSSGSLLVLEAESLEAVREIVQNDPFWTGNVVRDISPHCSRSAPPTMIFLPFERPVHSCVHCSGIKTRSRSKLLHSPSSALGGRQRPESVY